MRLLNLLLILLSCAVAQPAFADPVLDASEAYDKGDYPTALRLFAPLAEQGDVTAAFYLGLNVGRCQRRSGPPCIRQRPFAIVGD
jgi:hypothetical protein